MGTTGLMIFGHRLGLRLLSAFGLIVAALTGASLYAIDGGAAIKPAAAGQLHNSSDVKSLSSSNDGANDSQSSSNPSPSSGQAAGSSTSTSTNTTSVNGNTSTEVTVNGQKINVPDNGTSQQTIVSDGQKTTVNVSGSHTGTSSSTSVSSTSVQVSDGNGGDISADE